jgi:hypothetical protein
LQGNWKRPPKPLVEKKFKKTAAERAAEEDEQRLAELNMYQVRRLQGRQINRMRL